MMRVCHLLCRLQEHGADGGAGSEATAEGEETEGTGPGEEGV